MSSALPPRPRALVADDQRQVREALRLLLKAEGFETVLGSSPAGVGQGSATRGPAARPPAGGPAGSRDPAAARCRRHRRLSPRPAAAADRRVGGDAAGARA